MYENQPEIYLKNMGMVDEYSPRMRSSQGKCIYNEEVKGVFKLIYLFFAEILPEGSLKADS